MYLFQGIAFDAGEEIDHKHVSGTLLKPARGIKASPRLWIQSHKQTYSSQTFMLGS